MDLSVAYHTVNHINLTPKIVHTIKCSPIYRVIKSIDAK